MGGWKSEQNIRKSWCGWEEWRRREEEEEEEERMRSERYARGGGGDGGKKISCGLVGKERATGARTDKYIEGVTFLCAQLSTTRKTAPTTFFTTLLTTFL